MERMGRCFEFLQISGVFVAYKLHVQGLELKIAWPPADIPSAKLTSFFRLTL